LVEGIGAKLELRLERGRQRFDPIRGPACGRAGDDDEVAVRAERDAERDVDVERDRGPCDRRPTARGY